MLRLTLLSCLVLLVAFAPAPRVRAFNLNVDTQQLAPDQRGLLTLPTARTPGHLVLDASVVLGFGVRSVATGGGDGYNQATYDETLTVQVGLGDRTALALSLPASIVTVRGDNENGSTQGLGNPALDGRLRLLGPEHVEDARNLGGALALRGVLHAPIDRESPFYADSVLRTELDLLGELSWLGVRASGLLGYRHRFEGQPYAEGKLDSALRLGGGLDIPLSARTSGARTTHSALLEVNAGLSPSEYFLNSRTTPVEGIASCRLGVGVMRISVSLGGTLNPDTDSTRFRALLGLSYAPGAGA